MKAEVHGDREYDIKDEELFLILLVLSSSFGEIV